MHFLNRTQIFSLMPFVQLPLQQRKIKFIASPSALYIDCQSLSYPLKVRTFFLGTSTGDAGQQLGVDGEQIVVRYR